MPDHWAERMAQRYGDALDLPYSASSLSLEHCEPTDFVLYLGDWDVFVSSTPTWSAEQHSLRAHRTAQLRLGRDREAAETLERQQLAFAIASPDFDGRGPGQAASEMVIRRDVGAVVGFDLYPLVFGSKTYSCALSPACMREEEMAARYLRTYWDMLGY